MKRRAHVSSYVAVKHECGGKLEPLLCLAVQELLQPAIANEQPPAADDAQKRGQVAATAGVTRCRQQKRARMRRTCSVPDADA